MTINKRYKGFEKFQKDANDIFNEIPLLIDLTFEKVGAGFIPPMARYIICYLAVFAPIFGVCFLILADVDEEEPVRRKGKPKK